MKFNTILTASGVWKPDESLECYKLIKKETAGKKVAMISNAALTVSDKTYKDFVKNNLTAISKEVSEFVLDGNYATCILSADIVYIAGGDLGEFLDAKLQKDLAKNLVKFYKKGGLVIGESSGSIIFGPNAEWYYDIKKGTKPRYDVKPQYLNCLGLCNLYIYPHANKLKEEERLKCEQVAIRHGIEISYLNDGDYIKIDGLLPQKLSKEQ